MSDNLVRLGRPPKYDNVEALIKKIDEYFDSLEPKPLVINGEVQLHPKTDAVLYTRPDYPTVEGLTLYLGYADKQSLIDNDKGSFSFPIKRAKTRIIDRIIQYGLQNEIPPSLVIFMMKNFGYTDKVDLKANFDEDKSLLDSLINGSNKESET